MFTWRLHKRFVFDNKSLIKKVDFVLRVTVLIKVWS